MMEQQDLDNRETLFNLEKTLNLDKQRRNNKRAAYVFGTISVLSLGFGTALLIEGTKNIDDDSKGMGLAIQNFVGGVAWELG